MKRFILFLLFLAFLFTVTILTSCGDNQKDSSPDDSNSPESTEPNGKTPDIDNPTIDDISDNPQGDDDPHVDDVPHILSVFSFKIMDFTIEMDQDIVYVIEALGEPRGIFEEPSCAFDGIDRIFGYSNIQIHTYPKDDHDHIHTISLRDDSIGTTEGGIRLGAKLQDVIDAYGDDYKYDAGMYTFTRGLTTLEFFIDDGEVKGITYGFIIE
ncbi:MAG: hypothetical protein LBD23_03620 [Oscillospiraceae bacterium]|jgi:hypothetical protein|nr:hypothetical protein [Oscillospiraceae bacterium]